MYPNTPVAYGQTSAAVKQLQQFLISQGIQIPAGATGYFGDQTKTALTQWQQQNGMNSSTPGFGTNWGPRSIAAASGGTAGVQTQGPAAGAPPFTPEEANKALQSHPLSKGNSAEALAYAAETGDLSGLVNEFGQPFSVAEQKAALKQATKDNELYYKALKEKDMADTEAAMAQKQADYQNYLITSGKKFEADKAQADQNAANSGVLFSGGRVQKEKNLQDAYANEQAYTAGNYGRDIASAARDFQYAYGNKAAKGLSSYYKLGGNTYNANTAQNMIGSSGLSSVYNPNQYNWQGTTNVAQKTAANQRAAKYLANKGNKLLASGYSNQL